MIYILCFTVSSMFIFFSEKTKGYKSRMFLCIGILFPSVLAGIRAYNVGTDIMLYARQVFNSALHSSGFSWMFIWNRTYGVEYGYLLLNYIISRFTDNIAWQLFFVELFVLIFIYKALIYYRNNISTDNISVAYMFLIYYFLMYNESLNLMRQSMAVSIILYAFRYVYERKLVKYIIFVVLSMQFHITALLAVVIYPLYILICIKKVYQINYVLLACSWLSGIVLVRLLSVIINTGLLGDKFSKYINITRGGGFNMNQLVIRVPFILLFWYWAYRKQKEKSYNYFLVALFLLDLAFAELREVDTTLYRLSLYFSVYKCVAYPEIINIFVARERKGIKILLLLFVVVLWYYQIVIMDNGETYPYAVNPYL